MIALHRNTDNTFGGQMHSLRENIAKLHTTVSVVMSLAFFLFIIPFGNKRVIRRLRRSGLLLALLQREILKPDFIAEKDKYSDIKFILSDIKETAEKVKGVQRFKNDKKIDEILAENIALAYSIERTYRKKLFTKAENSSPSDLATAITNLSQNTISDKIYAS